MNTKFIGEAGEHFVAYKLASKELNIGLTLGNSPNVDILVSRNDGLKAISLQVKSSQGAYRKKRYGVEGFEWDVNVKVIGRHSIYFWYVFVDFNWNMQNEPDIFIVPSKWVAEFVKPDFSRYMYFLPIKAAEKTKNRLDILEAVLNDDNEVLEWADKWDDNILVRWGQ